MRHDGIIYWHAVPETEKNTSGRHLSGVNSFVCSLVY